MKADKEPRRRGDRERERRDDRDMRDQDHDDRDYEHYKSRDIMKQRFPHKRQPFHSGADQLHQDGGDDKNCGARSSYDDKTSVKSEWYSTPFFLLMYVF